MRDTLSAFRQTAARFLSLTNSQDEFFLVQVKDQAELTAPLTSSRDEIQSHLAAAEARGRTTLLDGIHLALDEMKKARNPRKTLLIICDSDGVDLDVGFDCKVARKLPSSFATHTFSAIAL